MPDAEALAARQRRLLAAVKGRAAGKAAFRGPELAMLRETLLWWRQLGLLQSCRFTTALLAATGRLDAAVETFVRETPGADSMEAQRALFLTLMARDRDPLCAAVAATEQALLLRMARPDAPPCRIGWPRDPGPVLAALLRGDAPGLAEAREFVLTVGPEAGGGLDWQPVAA